MLYLECHRRAGELRRHQVRWHHVTSGDIQTNVDCHHCIHDIHISMSNSGWLNLVFKATYSCAHIERIGSITLGLLCPINSLSILSLPLSIHHSRVELGSAWLWTHILWSLDLWPRCFSFCRVSQPALHATCGDDTCDRMLQNVTECQLHRVHKRLTSDLRQLRQAGIPATVAPVWALENTEGMLRECFKTASAFRMFYEFQLIQRFIDRNSRKLTPDFQGVPPVGCRQRCCSQFEHLPTPSTFHVSVPWIPCHSVPSTIHRLWIKK